jgi:phospholipid/cholesterol/gamma-HCH transport system substrate-binding protein
MPAAAKVRWAQLRVGVMAIVALTIIAVLIWLLTSEKPFWEHFATIYTYMRDSAALGSGSPVRLNGILVGSVRKVELTGSTNPNRVVRIAMNVQQDKLKDIPVDSLATISAENVLGTKYINIVMGKSSQRVKPGGEIAAEPTEEIEDLVKKGFNLFDATQAIVTRLDRIIGMVEGGQGTIGKLVSDEELYNRLVATVTEFQKLGATMNSGQGTVGKLLNDTELYDEARQAVQRLNAVAQDLQQGQGTAGKFLHDPALYDEMHATVADFRRLVDGLNKGQGTAGKLLKDETAYKELTAALAKLDTTLSKINSGQGTLGQLVVNPQLYESLNGVSSELHSLVKDIRANPKKFLNMKLSIF